MFRSNAALIREFFFRRLERKTGWGRTELQHEFHMAIADAALFLLEEKELKERMEETSES